jgi:hypothetical protein
MIDEEKLERYVETYYDKEEYLIRCDTDEELFQIAVQHLNEEPDLETLVEDLFDTLALREARWDRRIRYQGEHSYAVLKRNEPTNL